MAAEQRKLLEQLMGSQSLHSSSGQQPTEFTDRNVCRSFLVGECPHDIFAASKLDLGLCPKIHSEQLKLDYELASKSHEYGFEYDYKRDLDKYIDDCNRRVEAAQRRLEKSPEEQAKANEAMREITALEEAVELALEEIEVLGEAGLVARAMDEYYNVDKLKIDKEERERSLVALDTGADDHQKLQVCDVCGAYLSKLDNDRRLADHFGGKLHQGYSLVRRAGEANDAVIAKKKELGVQPPAEERTRSRSRERPRDWERDRGGYSGGHRGGGGYRGSRGGAGYRRY
ncbi:hypothetical protein BCR37DRAFT_6669 [Protomyces lactucae-debilis]|uniref:LUC7-domain-containing protein n=1 Tax=Protomyces lactucae-debilis TaxID=2754530 RepID=A0A1Y2FUQ6_PROLT|nr:uncharacterized protein BCR37DRAFT_6669 [Protomyces lactucae-debilis]ORY87743.1 hypothetical protein BCR37DRAFT_6669 [Protomyces lactucae-debilis]